MDAQGASLPALGARIYLVFGIPMRKVREGNGDGWMTDLEQAKVLAQQLLEVLMPYEEELIALERQAPAASHLRRAVGIAIAEACFCIADQSVGAADWPATANDPTRGAG